MVTGDEDHGLGVARQIEAGEVKVNGTSVMSLHLFTPAAGVGPLGLQRGRYQRDAALLHRAHA